MKILKIEYAWVEFLLCVLLGIRNIFLKIDRSKIDDAANFSLQDLNMKKDNFLNFENIICRKRYIKTYSGSFAK